MFTTFPKDLSIHCSNTWNCFNDRDYRFNVSNDSNNSDGFIGFNVSNSANSSGDFNGFQCVKCY